MSAERLQRLSPAKRRAVKLAGWTLAIAAPTTPIALGVADGIMGPRAQLETQAVSVADHAVAPVRETTLHNAYRTEQAFLDHVRAELASSDTISVPRDVVAAHRIIQQSADHDGVLFQARTANGAARREQIDNTAIQLGLVLAIAEGVAGSPVLIYRTLTRRGSNTKQ